MPRTKCSHCGWTGMVGRELVDRDVICPECEGQFTCRALRKRRYMAVGQGKNVRAPSRNRGQHCHEVDYDILGDDLQVVDVELDPRETVVAEAGAMVYMDTGIKFEAKLGDGSDPGAGFMDSIFSAGKRLVTGESLFLTHFTNESRQKRSVAFGSPFPGKIIPVNLSEVGGSVTCQKDAFLAAAYGTQIGVTLTKRLGTGFFGGEGFILQKLSGDGMAFMHAGGLVVQRNLENERLRVDTGCVVAFTPGIDFEIERSGGLKSMMFGGEGIFLASLKGTGTVWIQSLPLSRLAQKITFAGGSER